MHLVDLAREQKLANNGYDAADSDVLIFTFIFALTPGCFLNTSVVKNQL